MKNLYILCTLFISSLVLASNQSNELMKSFMKSSEYQTSFQTWKRNVIKYGLLQDRQEKSTHIPVTSYAQVIAFTDRQKTMQMLEVQIKQNQQKINYLQTLCERDYYKNKYQEASQKNVNSLISEQDSSDISSFDISSLSFSNDDTSHSKTIISEGNHVLDSIVNKSSDTIVQQFLCEESCVDTHVHTNNKNFPVYTVKKGCKNRKKGIVIEQDVETFTKEEIFYNLLQELKQRMPQQPAIDCTETKLVVTTIPQIVTPAKHTKHKKSAAVKNIASALKNYSDKDDTAILEEALLQVEQEKAVLKEQKRAEIVKKVAEARKKQEKETLHASVKEIFNIINSVIIKEASIEQEHVEAIFNDLYNHIPGATDKLKSNGIEFLWGNAYYCAEQVLASIHKSNNTVSFSQIINDQEYNISIIQSLENSEWYQITKPSEQQLVYIYEVEKIIIIGHYYQLQRDHQLGLLAEKKS